MLNKPRNQKLVPGRLLRSHAELESLRAVFKHLVALDLHLTRTRRSASSNGSSVENLNEFLRTNSYIYRRLEESQSDLNSEPSTATSDTNSIRSATEELGEECFLKQVALDLLNRLVSRRVKRLIYDDPLTEYLREKLREVNSHELYTHYYQEYAELMANKDAFFENVAEMLKCDFNLKMKNLDLMEVLKIEFGELASELNWIIGRLYNSRVNLRDEYKLIEEHDLNVEDAHISLNTLHFGLRMDEDVVHFFESKLRERYQLLLEKAKGLKGKRINYKSFYELVVETVEEIKSSRDKYGRRRLDGSRSEEIRSLLLQNVYGIQGKGREGKLFKLEPVPVMY